MRNNLDYSEQKLKDRKFTHFQQTFNTIQIHNEQPLGAGADIENFKAENGHKEYMNKLQITKGFNNS
jgi:hypothetical protein